MAHCNQCEYDWEPDVPMPKVCTRCKRYDWAEPKKRRRGEVSDEVRTMEKRKRGGVGNSGIRRQRDGARLTGEPSESRAPLRSEPESQPRKGVGKPDADTTDTALDVERGRKFEPPPCPRCQQRLTDRGEWFTCDNQRCSFKRVAEEEVERQFESSGE